MLISALFCASSAFARADNPILTSPRLQISGPLSVAGDVIPLHLRLGAVVSPRLRFDGGLDFTIPGLHIGQSIGARIDADAIISANFGGVTTLFPIDFDLVYHPSVIGIHGLYIGAGIGPYLGERTRLGGKILAGAELGHSFGLEGAIHFPGFGDPIFTIQLRSKL